MARLLAVSTLAVCFTTGLVLAVGAEKPAVNESLVWKIDNLQEIGGHKVRVLGRPEVISTAGGKAVRFDGQDDGLFLDVHPLAGLRQFTVEVIFRPDSDGPAAQRFFHMQERESEDRVMFETRLTDDGKWFLDTFIKTGPGNHTLFAEEHQHPLDRWYHAALVVDGQQMRHYVNGRQELTTEIDYRPQKAGQTSLGVRQNRVHWFKGAIRKARFTPRVLEPKEFWQP